MSAPYDPTNININVAVDTIGALSDGSLEGNLFLMDDGAYGSRHQGTGQLVTCCQPGQTIRWVAYAVDLQTPVAIKEIAFLPGDTTDEPTGEGDGALTMPPAREWSGVVPALAPEIPYRYRLTIQMGEGKDSVLYTNEPALLRCGGYPAAPSTEQA